MDAFGNFDHVTKLHRDILGAIHHATAIEQADFDFLLLAAGFQGRGRMMIRPKSGNGSA